jgi:hypothetical protein
VFKDNMKIEEALPGKRKETRGWGIKKRVMGWGANVIKGCYMCV